MSWPDFWIVLGITTACTAASRILPITLLANRPLPERAQQALSLIPAACFAALVANDLFDPEAFAQGLSFHAAMPLIAAIPVVLVSLYKKSLFLSVLTGVVCFALLYALA